MNRKAKHSWESTARQPFAPKYMETFHCIGSECEENCCHGRHVTIDKHTYKKYQTITRHGLSSKLKSIEAKSTSPENPNQYAHIKLDGKGHCGLLDENNLCEVHAKLGAGYLSKTCQTYPRYFIKKGDDLHLHASLSCPAAARKSLLEPDSMDLVSIALPVPNESALLIAARLPANQEGNVLSELSSYIADTAAHILRAPENRAWEAMIILGLMVRRMCRHLAGQNCADPRLAIVDTMISFIDPEYLNSARELVQGIAVERSHQIKLLTGVLRVYFTRNMGRSSFRQTISDALEGIQFDESDLTGSEARYNEAEERWFTPFDNRHPHILKNYLLNDIGKNTLPIGTNNNPEKNFLYLDIRFSLIRMMLIGLAGSRKTTLASRTMFERSIPSAAVSSTTLLS